MDTAPPQPAHLLLRPKPAEDGDDAAGLRSSTANGIPASLAHELWLTAEAEACDLTVEEFAAALDAVAEKHNCGQPAGATPTQAPGAVPGHVERSGYLQGLRLNDFALATGCALGREKAWQRFLKLYRAQLTQAAIAITGSATLGHDLADSLYAELYGLRTSRGAEDEAVAKRRSPLSSYSGRGSLLGWLRTTLAQRHVDHHRRTHRETSLDTLDVPAPDEAPVPMPAELAHLSEAVGRTLRTLDAEDRFLLSSYFLDRRKLLQIARILNVHEATISRRMKRLTSDLREHLLSELQAGGFSKHRAEEALGTDPRDVEINLRALLQTSHGPPFSHQRDEPPLNGKAASGKTARSKTAGNRSDRR